LRGFLKIFAITLPPPDKQRASGQKGWKNDARKAPQTVTQLTVAAIKEGGEAESTVLV
jgi:hypothetical protein